MKKQIFIIALTIILVMCSACSISSATSTSQMTMPTTTTTTTPIPTTRITISEPNPLAGVKTSGLLFWSNPPSDVSTINQGQQSGYAYVLTDNPTGNYLQQNFTISQDDSDGNFIQQLNFGGGYVAPLSYWATVIPSIGLIIPTQLQQWKITNVSTTIVTSAVARNTPDTGVGNSLGNLDFTNLSVSTDSGGRITLSGSLYNNDSLNLPTPKYVLIQVFIDSTGKGDYSLIGSGNLGVWGGTVPPPQEKDPFQVELNTNASLTDGHLTDGIISIEESY